MPSGSSGLGKIFFGSQSGTIIFSTLSMNAVQSHSITSMFRSFKISIWRSVRPACVPCRHRSPVQWMVPSGVVIRNAKSQ